MASYSLINVDEFERKAKDILPRAVYDYYSSGATRQRTLMENLSAFKRWYIIPRFFIDVSKCDLSTTVLGHKVKVPFGAAPSAMQKMAHPDGENGIARATSDLGTIYTLSTVSTTSIEDVQTNGLKFFQLYIYKEREVTIELVQRAEKAGYKALVLTVDAPKFGIRFADMRNKFNLPSHLRLENFANDGEKSSTVCQDKGEGSGIGNYVNSLFDPSLTWDDISWLKRITSLPIILKGILTPEDAVNGLNRGASAIWVSNHGARQLDGVLSTIDALPDIVMAVGHKCEVYVDSGFRSGDDIFKALAIGANMVFIGRPLLWGLACGGHKGALKVLNILRDELENTMKLSGCTSIPSIKSSMVTQRVTSHL